MFARTSRLMLRHGFPDDAPALAAAIADEAVILDLGKLPWPYSVEDPTTYLGRPRKQGEADLLIFARALDESRLVGGIGLARNGEHVELGYWIVPSQWGKGFATEAARAVIALAQGSLRLTRIVASHILDNRASATVLRNLGFVDTGDVVMRESRTSGRTIPCARLVLDLQPMALAA